MHDERREMVAKAIHERMVINPAWETASQVQRIVAFKLADAAIAALESATPGPATVSEAEKPDLLFMTEEEYDAWFKLHRVLLVALSELEEVWQIKDGQSHNETFTYYYRTLKDHYDYLPVPHIAARNAGQGS